MAKLMLGKIHDDKPLRLTIELPAAIHRDLVAYAEALGRETGHGTSKRRIWSPRCSCGSWRPTALSPNCGGPNPRRRHLTHRSRRNPASSRMKATNRPTAGSSASGNQARSTCKNASASSSGRKATPRNPAAAWLSVTIAIPKPAATSTRIDCRLAAWLRKNRFVAQ